MKEINRHTPQSCPLCGATYSAHPALSRTDNKTLICPDCGIRQALDSLGISEEEREKILKIIHDSAPTEQQ